MSDEQEENSEEEEENEDEDEEEEGEEEEEEEEEDDDEQQDEDEDEDGSNEDEEQEQQQGGSDEEESKEQSEEPQKLPKFRSVEPEEFKFTSLLSEISSLSMSVDHFITTLPSHGGSSSYYRSSYVAPPRAAEVPLVREEPRVVVMKDEDTQVSLQPQIVIQPTRIEKPPVEPAYKISNQSTKFLAQLYEENKKLKRWQNSSHSLNNHSANSAFYGSRQRFERQEYEKGLFNVQERNKEIDQAIEMLKREKD